ncbi:NADH dehydrogenase FAD-containing subunit [Spongiactinospora gelatinilytica]|uniref:NADH dehydrogenase FAD-containing subunit n=1 Tax=Spongiactinospora gelatinilytica TaxID=2666298 RepID=A0A2W2FXE4_9ACTN|nr:NAD(P)/FAD-dependent oxidoreductase [Spongiactinospora gelatinilytica]PZG29298.1 NADH dehydrogenase FAD-containing subunit [Spongiactinospora gelatinilytica]
MARGPRTPGGSPPRILIIGGGYVGLNTAMRLQRRLRPGEAEITVLDSDSYMTYQPFLPEAAAGSLEPRHVVVPLRRVLSRCRILNGWVVRVDSARRSVEFRPAEGESYEIGYDILVVSPGSVSRILPIPGLAENGIGFKTVEEAIHLRNHVLGQLDLAASTRRADVRRRALTFVFVGAGFAGVEALAELEDMAGYACRYHPGISRADMRWVLVEATGRILPEVGEEMGRWTLEQLRARGIDVRLNTRVDTAEHGDIVLSDGGRFPSGTLVWTAGVRPHPLMRATDLPVDDKDRLKVTPRLNVEGRDDVFSAGDCAAVPDLTRPGEYCAPNAQHAVRQARRLAGNIIATLRGTPLADYRHAYAGSVASLGLHKGVAQIYGHKLHGPLAWFVHRSYHLSRVPTINKKVRVLSDWTLALFFRREIVSFGAMSRPRAEFEFAARSTVHAGRLNGDLPPT